MQLRQRGSAAKRVSSAGLVVLGAFASAVLTCAVTNDGNALFAGTNALVSAAAQGTPLKNIHAPVSGFEGLITLDPVCGKMEPPTRTFPPGNPAPSTRRMAQRLAEIRDQANLSPVDFFSDRMVEVLQGKLTNVNEVGEKVRLQFQLAVQQLNSNEEALPFRA